ncbi:hypothetical protein QYE76_061168 [Lolium multiflorum]|uniref:CCHC-type domain-containing protein n=1 Tax=Lolium multiflorum TaxID=4521 RepID=A0AAD8S1T2_LOLMU|nr:hypothetical protein QYE76_061168 [Lolium multiflorum]
MLCHTCGGKGHFKRDCPNRKVMFINEDNEYETGDDVDPNAPEDDDYDTDGEDAYPSDARTIVVSQRALNVLPSASTQRCNLFQTKALVGPDKACKVIIDGGSCRNLASKELCTKLKLKYLPHPHPYYIQWLSDNGEMKVNHMVRVEFEIGPYKDCIDFDVVPMTCFAGIGDVFPEEVPAGLPPLRVHGREMNHIATGTAPSLDGELLPHRSSSDEDGGGDGAVSMEKPWGTSRSGGCRDPVPGSWLRDGGGSRFRGFSIGLVSIRGLLIGEEAAQGVTWVPSPQVARPGRACVVWGPPAHLWQLSSVGWFGKNRNGR